MSEAELRSPLHDRGLSGLAQPIDGSAGVWAYERPGLAFITLRGKSDDAAFTAAASKALGLALPIKPLTLTSGGTVNVLWLSPDEWMIIAPRQERARLLGALQDNLRGLRSQVADNSGGYTEVALMGRHGTDVLTHTSVYDVAHLAEGRVAGTTFGKASVYLYRWGAGWRLVVRRSFADYIWRSLVRAAEPYGFGVAHADGDAVG